MWTVYFITFVRILFDLMSFAIIARILMSWFHTAHHHPLYRFLYDVTEPVLRIAKKITPPLGMLDLSPMVALIALDILKGLILYFLGVL